MTQIHPESAEVDDPQPTELSLAPVDQRTTDLGRLHAPPLAHVSEPLVEPAPEAVRYSLRELLVVVTLAALLLAPVRYIGAAPFAAFTGVLTFLTLVYISLVKPSRGIIHVAWWVLLAVYVVAAIAALVNRNL